MNLDTSPIISILDDMDDMVVDGLPCGQVIILTLNPEPEVQSSGESLASPEAWIDPWRTRLRDRESNIVEYVSVTDPAIRVSNVSLSAF